MLNSNDQLILEKFYAEYRVKIVSCNNQFDKLHREILNLYKPINKYIEIFFGLRHFYEERQIAICSTVAQHVEPKASDTDIAGINPAPYLPIWSQEGDLVDAVEAPESGLESLTDADYVRRFGGDQR